MPIEREPVAWDIDLTPLIDVPVVIETEDGGRRKTVITDVVTQDIQLGDMICPLPRRLIMEDDENDWMDIHVLKSVVRAE